MKNKPKAIHRITALLLALLLTATILSPTITASAADTTETDSDRDSGGHQTGGDGESTQRPTHDPNDDTTITTNEDGTRTLKFMQRLNFVFKKVDGTLDWKHSFEVKGKGKFVIVSFINNAYAGGDDGLEVESYLLSNETFICDADTGSGYSAKSVYSYNGVYYTSLLGCISHNPMTSLKLTNFLNLKRITLQDGDTFRKALERLIDSGDLDLSKDDYMSKEEIEGMTPVRDESIGYLPRARYFDNRNNFELSFDYYNDYTATIQWDSFQEPYASDLENPYYVEIYAQIHYKLGKASNTSNVKMCQYKKYGEVKYVSERFTFPHREPADNYLLSIGAHLWSQIEGLNPDSDMAIVERNVKHYYVRLVHYDYDKQQLLCGGWTRLTLDENGGCTSEEGDFDSDNEDDWTPEDPDKDPDKWDDTGDEKDPNNPDPDNPDPDNPDFGIDTSDIGKFILSLISSLLNSIKSILLLVGEFPSLCGYVFSFLPNDIGTLMFCGTAAIIFMRFLGR